MLLHRFLTFETGNPRFELHVAPFLSAGVVLNSGAIFSGRKKIQTPVVHLHLLNWYGPTELRFHNSTTV